MILLRSFSALACKSHILATYVVVYVPHDTQDWLRTVKNLPRNMKRNSQQLTTSLFVDVFTKFVTVASNKQVDKWHYVQHPDTTSHLAYVRPLPAARAEPFTGVMLPSSAHHHHLLLTSLSFTLHVAILPFLLWCYLLHLWTTCKINTLICTGTAMTMSMNSLWSE